MDMKTKLAVEIDDAQIAGAIANSLERIARELRALHATPAEEATFEGGQPVPEATGPVAGPPAPGPQAFFTGFAGPATEPAAGEPGAAQAPEASAAAEPAAPAKRKRRTKAEIEADRIREANELLAKQQAQQAPAAPAAPPAPPGLPSPEAQFPPMPQAPQAQAPAAGVPTQPPSAEWTPSWGYPQQPQG